VYFIIFKWNIELLQIFIFELVQYTFYQYFICPHCIPAVEFPQIMHFVWRYHLRPFLFTKRQMIQ